MKAITLWPEWAWAIAALAHLPDGKRVENRTWTPNLAVGERFAIHAGKSINGGRGGAEGAHGAIYAVMLSARASLYECTSRDGAYWLLHPLSHERDAVKLDIRAVQAFAGRVVATAIYAGADREQQAAWDDPGQWHWRLEDIVVVHDAPVVRGAQGLWTLPDGAMGDGDRS